MATGVYVSPTMKDFSADSAEKDTTAFLFVKVSISTLIPLLDFFLTKRVVARGSERKIKLFFRIKVFPRCSRGLQNAA